MIRENAEAAEFYTLSPTDLSEHEWFNAIDTHERHVASK